MPYNPLFKLKSEPVFDIEKDLEKIRQTPPADGKESALKNKKHLTERSNVIPMLCMRAYILAKNLEPLAIFNNLPSTSLGVFIKVALCVTPKKIDLEEYPQVEAMNHYKYMLSRNWVKRPFKLAFFVADQLWYHVSIPVDLMVYLCNEFDDYDLVDRSIWEFITLTEEWDDFKTRGNS